MIDIQDFLIEYRHLLEERQTVLPEPANELIGRYFFLLKHENNKINLTGYKTLDEYIDFHLLDTLRLADTLTRTSGLTTTGLKIMDVGTGCGVPGIILQILFPECSVGLIESTGKKTEFLEKSKTYLNIRNLNIIKGRAEDLGREPLLREAWDLVIARALGSFSATLELTVCFAKVGGFCLYPRSTDNDTARENKIEELLKMERVEEKVYSLPGRDRSFRIIIMKKADSTPEKYPRKPGQIQKRPL